MKRNEAAMFSFLARGDFASGQRDYARASWGRRASFADGQSTSGPHGIFSDLIDGDFASGQRSFVFMQAPATKTVFRLGTFADGQRRPA